MTSADPFAQIQSILVERHGVRISAIKPEARILHDLGVDGGDAAELFEDISNLFGTDFSALNSQWATFFNSEGISIKAILISLPICLACGGIAGVFAAYTDMPKWTATIGALALFAGGSWLYSQRFGRKLTPLTIGGLAQIVQTGAWPNDPADVH